jgi:hypothetical protein
MSRDWSASEEYREVTAVLKAVGAKAFKFAPPPGRQADVWVARSLLHGGDEIRVSKASLGAEVTFRLLEWVCEREGWA